jgi:N-methylhydantoinase A
VGQRHELRVPLAPGRVTARSLVEARLAFDRVHGLNYAHERPGDPVEIRAIAVTATVPRPKPALRNPGTERLENALKEYRSIHLMGETSARRVPVYERPRLATGTVLRGPAVLESPDATVVICPGQTAAVHHTGTIMIEW